MRSNQENTKHIIMLTSGFTATAKANLCDIFMMLGDYGLPERSHTSRSTGKPSSHKNSQQH